MNTGNKGTASWSWSSWNKSAIVTLRSHWLSFLSTAWFQLNGEMSKIIRNVLDDYPGNNSTTEQAWDFIQRNVSRKHWSGVRFRLIAVQHGNYFNGTTANMNMNCWSCTFTSCYTQTSTNTQVWLFCRKIKTLTPKHVYTAEIQIYRKQKHKIKLM